MNQNVTEHQEQIYDTLMNCFVPFWEKYSPDPEYGGFLCGFDRDGGLFLEDKSVWQQGRSTWMFAKLYNEFGQKPEWLEISKSGYRFIREHCFAENGHMYFRVTRDGRPLVERRYYFSEAFAIMGYVELYLATGDESVRENARELFGRFYRYYTVPGIFQPKVNPETRKNKGHSIVMIMLNVCQHMRRIDDSPLYDEIITGCIDQIVNGFVKEDEKVLLETVGPNNERIHSPEGRLINPGHALETSWFIMQEALYRKDDALMRKMIQVAEWSLNRGWDPEMGGIFYFQDVEGKPVLSLEWDMKLLWVHCEAMIAMLYAYGYTGEKKYFDWFEKLKAYIYKYYPDEGHPEWFGHLHRDGSPINYIKGSDWKGPFHNVRAFMLMTQLLKKLEQGQPLT